MSRSHRVGVIVIVLVLAACGGDDSSDPTGTTAVPTTQDANGGDGGSDGGSGGGGGSGDAGSATVTVSTGTYELQLEEPCLISGIGIGAIASSGEATLSVAGIPGATNVGLELASGELWFAAAAPVEIDDTTMSYNGPAIGPETSDDTISIQVFCDELMDVPGG